MKAFWLLETLLVVASLNFLDTAHAISCGKHVSLLWTGWSVNARIAADVWLALMALLNAVTMLTERRGPGAAAQSSGTNKYIRYRSVLAVAVLVLRLTIALGWVTGCAHSVPVVFAAVVIPFRLTEHTVNASLMYNNTKDK